MSRIFLIVLDSLGIGNAHDAKMFGDLNSNTLKSLQSTGKLKIPNLKRLGLLNINGVGGEKEAEPIGKYCNLVEKSVSKDTITGHWEMMGVVSTKPTPTFPYGFPTEFIKEFSKRINRGVLCNRPYSGTNVITDFGEKHLETGDVIVYTSADSVFQVAAHIDKVPLEELYEICKVAREMLQGDLAVSRVIARPFTGKAPNFERCLESRHDYGLIPPKNTMNDIQQAGKKVIAVGKIGDIFSGSGITESYRNKGNAENLKQTIKIVKDEAFDNGLCFVNLVDFDMIYGHRRNVEGYTECLNNFDKWLGEEMIPCLKSDDVLMITADHGCDPLYSGTDHTRETVPLLIYGKNIEPENLGTIYGFDYVSTVIKKYENL